MNVLKAILLTLLYVVVMEVSALWFYIFELFEYDGYINYYLFIQGSVQVLVVVLGLYLIYPKAFQPIIRKTPAFWYLAALLLGILFVFLQTPLDWLRNLVVGIEHQIRYDFDGLSGPWSINLLATCLLLPFVEELFFRSFLQENLRVKLQPAALIIVIAALFSIIHAPYYNLFLESFSDNWHQTYMTFFGGIISGWLYYRTESLGPSLLYHASWNFFVFLV